MRLADFAIANMHNRQRYAWKVNIALWFLIALGIGFARSQSMFVAYCVLAGPVLVALLAYAFLWSRANYEANVNDRALALHFYFESEKILREPDHRPLPHPARLAGRERWLGFLWHWSHLFELTVMATLAALLVASIGR
jgi:hypothetical protein